MLVELNRDSTGGLRAVFFVNRSWRVWIEIGPGAEIISNALARQALATIERIIDNSRFALPDPCACDECEWHYLSAIIRRCRQEAHLASFSVTAGASFAGELQEAPRGCSFPDSSAFLATSLPEATPVFAR